MDTPFPLAQASARRCGKPGRPRKRSKAGPPGGPAAAAPPPEVTPAPCAAAALTAPRLLDLPTAAAYLGLSPWTVRELIWCGVLPRVRISRKILLDRHDLDALIDASKEARPASLRGPE